VCYSAQGEPASTKVVLAQPGTRAIFLMLGTKTEHLGKGVVQLINQVVLDDLVSFGAVGVDFHGANLPGVSTSKEAWGPTLVPYYTLEDSNLRQLAKRTRDWWRYYTLGKRRNAEAGPSSLLPA
jgi:hypothetical protein